MEDEEWKNLPAEEKCVHKQWKARVNGYEELTKLFRQIDDEKSPEFGKYLGLVKKFVTDSNAVGQEKGLEATLAYIESYALAGKTVSEVMSGIVLKCIAAPKTKTRELALQVTLMYVEIEKFDAVQEELMKGTEQKNPKIVSACIQAITTALREFGIKIMSPKPMIKRIGALFSDRDLTVRQEARNMVVELYKWMGPNLMNHLKSANLQPVQMTELETEFAKVEGQKASPSRYIRSQQQKQAKLAASTEEPVEDEDEQNDDEAPQEIDVYDLADPVDILSKLPRDFYEKLEAKKWQERKEALEAVETLLKNPKLENGDYGDLVRALKKVVQKDSNVICVALAGRCIAGLATGLKKRFQTYSGALVLSLLEKFKEKKQNVVTAIREAIDATYLTTHLEAILEDVLESLNNKNPTVKMEVSLFLARGFTKTQPATVNKKILKALTTALVKNINESDPSVRESSAEALGTLMKLVGEKAVAPFFGELEKDKLKMDKIKEFHDKAEITVKVAGVKKPRAQTAPSKPAAAAAKEGGSAASKPVKKPVGGAVAKSASANSLDAPEEDGADAEPINVQDLLPRVDISGQITEALLNELSDKNWKERIEALTKLSTIIQEAKFIKPNLGDLPQPLATRLTDSNVKIAQTALNICQNIAKSMGPPSKQYIRTWFPGFVQNLGDSKAWMRTTALETINAFAEQCGHKDFFEGEMIADGLKTGSPTLRSELWNWLAEVLPKLPVKSIPKEELLACVPHLYSNLEDRNADVRKNTGEAVLGIMMHLGYDSMAKLTEKVKPVSKNVVTAALEKARPNLPVKPLPIRKASAGDEKSVKGTKPVANKQNAVKPTKSNSAPGKPAPPTSGGRKKEEDIDTSPLLVVNNLKHQRTIDESKLKILKWNFTQPREEFVDLLKDQMTNASVNRMLMANMFHSDFRYHIKAIESLMEDLPDRGEALISNLDLILKWLTLRFFDTNPSVLLKGLEYLHSVFNMLIEKQYRMLENEGSCFIPYLVLKIGDPKDSVRNGVRALLKQISGVFPVSRLSVYVMEGVKSKNARQRAECLEVMGSMIEDYTIAVCQPTPAACLKEVAKQISDRDNSVRNAALNCVVQAFNIVGEKVYKMVGNISEKDMSLLEERIKRSSRRSVMPKSASVTMAEVPPPSRNGVGPNDTLILLKSEEEQEVDEDEPLPVPALPPALAPEQPRREVQGPFKLESEFMNDLDKITPHFQKLPIENIDLEFLKEEVKMPSFFDNKAKIMPLSPPKPVIANKYNVHQGVSTSDPDIQKVIALIASQNLAMALQGLTQFAELMNSPVKIQMFHEYEGDFFEAMISLLKYLNNLDPVSDPTVARIYRDLFKSIDTFYQKPQLGKGVPIAALKQLLNQLILLLVEQKLEKCGDVYVKIININCVKIIEQSDHTAVLCALVKLMTECVTNDNCPERHVDLVMKCLWKVIKLMPSWGDNVDYESVLLDLHHFLVKFPSKWWSTRPVDTPLRTIKTILHSTVKIKGANSMQLLGKIPNPAESDIESYILRLLKSLKIAQAQDVPLQSQRNSLSRANHNMLTEIFQKIGNKEDTKEGLNLLYDFMQQHPEADMEPFLSKSSKFFQEYIRGGLKEIDNARKSSKPGHGAHPYKQQS